MATGSVFVNNRTQSVRLPAETRFPDGVKRVTVRVVGHDRIISPVEKAWDSFFDTTRSVSDDFMDDRKQPELQSREKL